MTSIPSAFVAYVNGLKNHDVAGIATTLAEDVRFITPANVVGKDRFLTFLRSLYAAFPDWSYDHDEPEMRGEEIAVRWRQGGSHTGTLVLSGIPSVMPTGKKVQIPAQYFYYRVRDGLIVEIRPEPIAGGAPLGIWQQLGITWPAT
jgi:predicted ester cyclase